MLPRIRLLSLLVAAFALSARGYAANLDGSTTEAGNAEAARLYADANAYVTNMAEGQYSYSYLQFYWKRAQANIDRIRRVYPDSPTSSALAHGELKLGPFELGYFKERILYNLELKQLGSFDDVNCAIFLYGLDENRSDPTRDEALDRILEVMARRQRWGEALRFPVLDVHRPLLLHSIFRIAAFYDQPAIIRKMTHDTSPADRKAAGFDPLLAEAQALLGRPRSELYTFVADHPGEDVRSAALRGIVERAILVHRMDTHHLPSGESIQTVHLVVQNLSVRDDVHAVAKRLYADWPDGASPQLELYSASLGISPGPGALVDAHLAYMQYLADADRLDAVGTYVMDNRIKGSARRACELKAAELFAEAGHMEDAEKIRMGFASMAPEAGNAAALAEFRGRMDSTEVPLVARQHTFSDAAITDPCVMAIAIMDWSLTPNRSQRGATPWDAVVKKFAGGFENLPRPKSAAVGDAASTVKPY
jgi:hypothetical protein